MRIKRALRSGSENRVDPLHTVLGCEETPMDLATQTHLTSLRGLLNFRLAELRAEVRAAQQARLKSGEADSHDVADRKDDAMQQQFEGVDDAKEQRDIDELAQVESALKRLDSGAYGNCSDCGEPIPLQRLRVQPAALRCAGCQGALEQAHVRSS
jgi:RNA polymerase-binding protein DksA